MIHPKAWIYGLVTFGAMLMNAVVSESSPIGKCGSEYTEPREMVWLTNNAQDCTDEIPCGYTIKAPTDNVVRLNFTKLSGLASTESKTEPNIYDLINGQSNCQPRIEVTETYHTKEDVPVTQRKTLCYDRIFGSSVIIETQSNNVQLAVFCLATKYSFFAMNFAFIHEPAACTSLECNGQCLLASQVCDGVPNCESGEDELNCGMTEIIQSSLTAPEAKSHDVVIIIVVLAVVLALAVMSVCIYLRWRSTRRFTNCDRPVSSTSRSMSWRDDESREVTTTEAHCAQTQKLLQQDVQNRSSAMPRTSSAAAQSSPFSFGPPANSAAEAHINRPSSIPTTHHNTNQLTTPFPVRPAYTHDTTLKQCNINLDMVQRVQDQIAREIGKELPRNVQIVPRNCSRSVGAGDPNAPPSYYQQQQDCELDTGAYPSATYPRLDLQQHSCSLQFVIGYGSGGSNRDYRRQSVASHTSHKSEPPSYEMATNPELRSVCLSPPEINTTTTRACPLCQQSL